MNHDEITKRGELKSDTVTNVRTLVEDEADKFRTLQRDMDKMVELLNEIGTTLLNYNIKKYIKDEGINENTHLRKVIVILHEKNKLYDKETGLLTMAGIHCVAAIINVMPIMMPNKYVKCLCGETHFISKYKGHKKLRCPMFGVKVKAVAWNRLALSFYSEVFKHVLKIYKLDTENIKEKEKLSPIEEKCNNNHEFKRKVKK